LMEFSRLSELYEQLEGLRSRREMVGVMSDFLRSLKPEEVGPACSMLLGSTLGVGWATVRDAILGVTGLKRSEFLEAFSRTGDLGEASKLLFGRRRVRILPLTAGPLTVLEVWRTLGKLGSTTSLEQKRRLLEGLFNRCSAAEAKILTKVLTREMRAGFSEGLLRRALAKAYSASEREVEIACGFGSTPEVGAALSRGEGLDTFAPRIFRPINPMLAETAGDVEEALAEHGGRTSVEFKLDGARVQVHALGSRVAVFSRGREEVTQFMPEVVGQVRELKVGEAILEGEVIALREGFPLPFQFLMRRFRRKKTGESEVCLNLHFFDLLLLDGRWMLEEPYSARRERLEEIAGEGAVQRKMISRVEEGEEFLQYALWAGHEGVMAKAPESPYLPGRRGKSWLKIKPTFTLDLVIVGAEWGYGRRAKYLSDYYLAALDEKTGKFEVVGKTFKGLTNEELGEMTRRLRQLQIGSKGRAVMVKPEIVVEVSFNQVQRSPKYTCGMALRFARIERIREDKRPEEADTLERVRSLLPSILKP
jgi:DNA ligase-1